MLTLQAIADGEAETTFVKLQKFFYHSLIACLASLNVYGEDTAKVLFGRSAPIVFQVKVIDIASGNKSTIGSGFQVTQTGVIATNYHVVSQYILEKDKYLIEILDHENNTHQAALLNFDIVHDLALLKVGSLGENTFSLNLTQPAHGNRIYAMGNPHDLGMTIIEGNYNGLVEASRYQKYLFSGSLNGGMSGGPALNHAGEVIGINVSKGAEQLSFLVPAIHLKDLMAQGSELLSSEKYNSHALNYLVKDQENYYRILLEQDWETKEFQRFQLPDKIHNSLKCWGHTLDKKANRFEETHRHCNTEDEIYLKQGFYTGVFSFTYENFSSDELNTQQFYALLEENYKMREFTNGNAKEDTTNFKCSSNFVKLAASLSRKKNRWKVTSCVREYVNYRGLYDTGLLAMHADAEGTTQSALKISLLVAGIDKNNIYKLHRKFLDSVQWQR